MKVPEKFKKRAINFLLPDISDDSIVYKHISELIDQKFNELHCCVLYYLNEDFMKIISSNQLYIGSREVIITNGSLLAGECSRSLTSIYTDEPFIKSKTDVKVEPKPKFDSYVNPSPDYSRNFCW